MILITGLVAGHVVRQELFDWKKKYGDLHLVQCVAFKQIEHEMLHGMQWVVWVVWCNYGKYDWGHEAIHDPFSITYCLSWMVMHYVHWLELHAEQF